MSNSANEARSRLWQMLPKLPPAPQLRCKVCLLPYPAGMMRSDTICVHCYLAEERIRDAATAAAEYIHIYGQEAWDAELERKCKELF